MLSRSPMRGLEEMLCLMTLPPMSVAPSSRFIGCDGIWAMVTGRFPPLWACSFWELIGRKKALDVREGTWLRLARFRREGGGAMLAGPAGLSFCAFFFDLDLDEPAVFPEVGLDAAPVLFLLPPVLGR